MSQTLKAEAPDLAQALAGWEWRDDFDDDDFDDADVIRLSTRGAWFFLRMKGAKAATGNRAQRFATAVQSVMAAGHRGNITPHVRHRLLITKAAS